jgi:hypothetical protein
MELIIFYFLLRQGKTFSIYQDLYRFYSFFSLPKNYTMCTIIPALKVLRIMYSWTDEVSD